MQPDFVANVIGFVVAVGSVSTTTAQPMKSFQLMDGQGRRISCCAMGTLATSGLLTEGHKVMAYSVTGKRGRGSYNGTFWLYEQSYVVVLEERCRIPKPQTEITLPSSSL